MVKTSYIWTFILFLTIAILLALLIENARKDNYSPPQALSDMGIQKKYFTLPQGRWLGGDAATSFPLNDDINIWLFGDTFIGDFVNGERGPGSAFIHQSIGVNKNGHMTYKWAEKDGVPTTAIDPIKEDGYYWFLQGIQDGYSGPTLILASRIVPAHNFLGFDVAATSLIKIKNILDPPDKWQYVNTDLPQDKFGKTQWTAALTRNPKNPKEIYIMGLDSESKAYVLAKAPLKDWVNFDFSTTKFWSKGDKWTDNSNNLKPLFGANEAGTETSLVYKNGMWYSMAIPAMSNKLILYWSDNITGQWNSKQIYIIPLPENGGVTYAPKFHPELSGPNDLVITYNTNLTGDDAFKNLFTKEGADVYVPKVLRLKI